MDDKFQKYSLEDFLDDPDFCSWVRSERPELDDFYYQLLVTHPTLKDTFQRAQKIIQLFDDVKLKTDQTRKAQLWKEINKIYRQRNNQLKNYRLLYRYAAIITLLFAIGSLSYYLTSTYTKKNFLSVYNKQDFTETRLMLDNGIEINIKDDQSQIVYDQNNEQVKVNDKLVPLNKGTKSSAMNRLIVPFGKQSKIILADQTEVWLNAGSQLIYPTVFEGGRRKVQLQGEAFFKVSKDKSKPFIVETANSNIKVLGTSFNVRSYPDEKVEETVLVEGSVSLNLGKTILGKDILLRPDQRLVVTNSDNTYEVTKVNVADYTSWIEGMYGFKDEPLPLVLMRISRYYNLEIKWTKEIETHKISGKLDLKDDYHRVLRALAMISDGNFTEKDGIIYFKLNKNKEMDKK